MNTNRNSRYSMTNNNSQNKQLLNQNNNITSSSNPKKDVLSAVPLANNIGDENSFFNAIIHMLYFTPEILEYLEENQKNFKGNFSILYELYKILDKYNKLLDRNKCALIPEEERYIDIKNLRKKWVIQMNLLKYFIFS